MLNQTIEEFGRSMGIDGMAFNDDKVVHLEVEGVGDLYLEDEASYLLLYIVKEVDSPSLKLYKKAFTLCHYRQKNPFSVQVGLHEDNKLTFLVKLPHEGINESNLEKAIEFLNKLHNQVINT